MSTFYYKTKIGYLKIILEESKIKKSDFKIISCIFVDDLNKNENKKEVLSSAAEGGAIEKVKLEIKLELDNYFKNGQDFSKEFIKKYIDINNLDATDFQKDIWKIILKVKLGEIINYTEMAEKVGDKGAARAAGSACGKNPLALFIPCHRVLRKDGEVNFAERGYSWGPERKTWLLKYEGHIFKKNKS